jgi:hypothetical protein
VVTVVTVPTVETVWQFHFIPSAFFGEQWEAALAPTSKTRHNLWKVQKGFHCDSTYINRSNTDAHNELSLVQS